MKQQIKREQINKAIKELNEIGDRKQRAVYVHSKVAPDIR